MSDVSVMAVDPSSPENSLPPDLATMRATAFNVLNTTVLRRHPEIMTLVGELRGMVKVLVETLDVRVTEFQNIGRAMAFVNEGRYRLCTRPGEGLQSAHDCAYTLAQVVENLADLYEELQARDSTPGTTAGTPRTDAAP